MRTPTRAEGGLTKAERVQCAELVRRWTLNAFQTGRADPQRVRRDITALYAAADLPPPRVVLVPSPFVMACAYGIAATWWEMQKKRPDAIRNATYAATEAATDAATDAATHAATSAATDVATYDATYAATRDATFAATNDATEAATSAATRDATSAATSATSAAAEAATRAATFATYAATSAAIEAATRDATSAAIEAATEAATRDATWLARLASAFCVAQAPRALARIKEWSLAYQGGNMWSAFPCYAQAMRDVLGLTGLACWKPYAAWEQAAQSGGFRALHPKFCLVSDFPERLLVDDQHRPHAEHGPSHRWRDGFSLYHLHGVRFPKALYERIISRAMPMAEVLRISNIDQRTQAMRFASSGLREWFRAEKGVVLDTHDKLLPDGRPVHYELWKLPPGGTFTRTVQFCFYVCPSALHRGEVKEFMKGVPEVSTVAEAMAWGMSGEGYAVTPQAWKALQPLVAEA